MKNDDPYFVYNSPEHRLSDCLKCATVVPNDIRHIVYENPEAVRACLDLLDGAKDLFEKLPEIAMLGAKLRIAINKAEGK